MTWSQFFTRYVATYQAREHTARHGNYILDYVPGKLLINALFIWHERELHPHATDWSPKTIHPLLWFNTILELIAALAMFFLVRYWVIRGTRAPPPRQPGVIHQWLARLRRNTASAPPAPAPAPSLLRMTAEDGPIAPLAAMLGLVAALCVWLNPGVILSGHAWAQWDVDLVPFYLLAVLLASLDWFAAAAVVLCLGALVKGQLLFVGAIFVFWPLFEGRPGAAVRFLIGGMLTFGLATAAWLFRPVAGSWEYLASVIVAAGLVTPWIFMRQRRQWYWGFALLITVPLVLWPWWFGPAWRGMWAAALLATLLVALPWRLSPRQAPWFIAAATVGGMVLIACCFHGTFAWWRLSYGYGTHHYLMLTFPDTCGLQNILAHNFHWTLFETVFTLHLPWLGAVPVPMRSFLFLSFVATLLLCAWGAARQHRRNDPRFLIAMVTPWLTFYALGPQMHERYLVWAAAMLPVAVVVSFGLLFLDLFLSVLTCTMMLAVMFVSNQRDGHALRLIRATEPGAGYAVILCALIFLYLSIATTRGIPLARLPAPPRPRADDQ